LTGSKVNDFNVTPLSLNVLATQLLGSSKPFKTILFPYISYYSPLQVVSCLTNPEVLL